eukprot:scaffold359501_cov86-Cyclotella_meneghiniana.AAC.1
MTGLYVNEIRNENWGTEALQAASTDTVPRADGPLGIHALSHVNVVVNDSVDSGAEYYEMLGFYPASNADGPMNYTNVTNHGFCVDAGFESCRVDILFLKHEIINLYLELFFYYEPVGDRKIPIFNTNDAGGIRHIAVEVVDAVQTYEDLKAKDHQGTIRDLILFFDILEYCRCTVTAFITKGTPIPLDPFPYTFMYWIDRYGVQWEFEQGRPVEYYSVAGITG